MDLDDAVAAEDPPARGIRLPRHPHSHHGTPAHEYAGFNFASPSLPMDPSAFSSSFHHRPMHQQLHPLVMPQWPSMLNTPLHSSYQPMYPQPVQPIHPGSIAPLYPLVSAASPRSSSTPRKMLTDLDRKRMCQYAEEHPNSKQTEIGAIFGVERSTVSKVLRQKEKYLVLDDGSPSPVKRAKGRSPDIERALAVWAKNQEKKGNPLTDDLIRQQARAFAATTTIAENHVALSSSWIEKFKLKNNLMGARSRKASLAPDDLDYFTAQSSSSHTPGDTSPISPFGFGSPSPIELHSTLSQESPKNESPDSYLEFDSSYRPFHSQRTNSLNSAFTDTTPSSFSPGPRSPTSPFFTPDSGTAPSPFVPHNSTPLLLGTTGTNSQRPRSQTFPSLDQFMTSSGESVTPKYVNSGALDSPMEEPSDPLGSLNVAIQLPEERPITVTPSETMRPPPLPAHVLQSGIPKRESIPTSSAYTFQQVTTHEEARRALQVVLAFFEQQPHGFLDFQESVTMGKLMEKLNLQSRGSS